MCSDRNLLVMCLMTHPLSESNFVFRSIFNILCGYQNVLQWDLRIFAGQKQSAYLFSHTSQLFSQWNITHLLCMRSNAHFVCILKLLKN